MVFRQSIIRCYTLHYYELTQKKLDEKSTWSVINDVLLINCFLSWLDEVLATSHKCRWMNDHLTLLYKFFIASDPTRGPLCGFQFPVRRLRARCCVAAGAWVMGQQVGSISWTVGGRARRSALRPAPQPRTSEYLRASHAPLRLDYLRIIYEVGLFMP